MKKTLIIVIAAGTAFTMSLPAQARQSCGLDAVPAFCAQTILAGAASSGISGNKLALQNTSQGSPRDLLLLGGEPLGNFDAKGSGDFALKRGNFLLDTNADNVFTARDPMVNADLVVSVHYRF